MNLNLRGKIAIVTGGNSGLGKAIAMAFAAEGAKVVIAARNISKCEETVRLIKDAGGDCSHVKVDVQDPREVEEMVRRTVDTYGRLDCAVNNARHHAQGHFHELSEDEWDTTIDVSLKGVWLCMKYQIPELLKSESGSIVNVGSTAGLRGYPMLSPYVLAKHGLVGLGKAAAAEYAARGIRINTICPGTMLTEMLEDAQRANTENIDAIISTIPMRRFGRLEEVSSAVLWLSSGSASYVTGVALGVDGGLGQH